MRAALLVFRRRTVAGDDIEVKVSMAHPLRLGHLPEHGARRQALPSGH
jgi:hypothetical protein